ncbi:MAG: Bro-N domain-containing protein [Thermodesulfobacteriota bacterium]
MTNITQLIHFEDAEMRIYDINGERWVTAKEQAAALGYTEIRSFQKLIQDMADRGELKQGVHFMFIPLPTAGGKQESMVLSYKGVIRTAMRSDAPNAIKFRDWAEEVLFQVMVTGVYGTAEYVPPSGARVHWTDMLSPSEQLRLAEMRVKIWLKLAENPTSRALWLAHYDTWGGRSGWVRYAKSRNLPIPQTDEDWARLDDLSEPQRTPEERWPNGPGPRQ